MFVGHIVLVFREVWRVLRKDGTLWLNLGDSYATGAGRVGNCPGGGDQGKRWRDPTLKRYRGNHADDPKRKAFSSSMIGPMIQPNRMPIEGLKPKDLVGIPWRVAFALQADGWYLRSDIIWHKPNPMPESVVDRCTKSHEYVFLLTKSPRYFYDAEAIKEPAIYGFPNSPESIKSPYGQGFTRNNKIHIPSGWDVEAGTHGSFHKDGRRKNSAYSFKRSVNEDGKPCAPKQHRPDRDDKEYSGTRNKRSVWAIATQPFKGAHFATMPEKLVEPCILAGSKPGDVVLDPFGGTMTVGRVAERNGREFVGLDLSSDYIAMGKKRMRSNQIRLVA